MNERKIMYKWFWVWEFEKEERWLNQMAMEGWALVSVGYSKYIFERCQPGDYIIRLEMHNADTEYISFMNELGAEYLGNIFKWIYFRRKAEFGEFDVFSDIDSKIRHIDGISKFLTVFCVLNLIMGVINSFNPTVHIGFINLLVAALLAYGIGRLHGKKESLQKDRQLYE